MTDFPRWRLATGEVLLWQGRPADLPPAREDPRVAKGAILVFGGLLLAILILARDEVTDDPQGWLMVGVYVVLLLAPVWYFTGGRMWLAAWRRRRTRYALTDRRAVIAVRLGPLWRRRSHPVTGWNHQPAAAAAPADLWFHRASYTGRHGTKVTWTGFEAVADPLPVQALMQAARRAAPVRGAVDSAARAGL